MKTNAKDHAARVAILLFPPALPWVDDGDDDAEMIAFVVAIDGDDADVAARVRRDGRLRAEAV